MEILLTVLLFVWQLGWLLLLGGVVYAGALWLIRPLRKWKKGTFAACVLAVVVLLAALFVRPVVIGGSAEERETARQLAAGPYSWMPITPLCAVVEPKGEGMLREFSYPRPYLFYHSPRPR